MAALSWLGAPTSSPSALSYHESTPVIEEMNLLSSPITQPFFKSHRCFNCMEIGPGEKYDSTVSKDSRYGNNPVMNICAWSPSCGCQPKIVPLSLYKLSTERYKWSILPWWSSYIIREIIVRSDSVCWLLTIYMPYILQLDLKYILATRILCLFASIWAPVFVCLFDMCILLGMKLIGNPVRYGGFVFSEQCICKKILTCLC